MTLWSYFVDYLHPFISLEHDAGEEEVSAEPSEDDQS